MFTFTQTKPQLKSVELFLVWNTWTDKYDFSMFCSLRICASVTAVVFLSIRLHSNARFKNKRLHATPALYEQNTQLVAIKNGYFPKHAWPTDVCNGDVMCFPGNVNRISRPSLYQYLSHHSLELFSLTCLLHREIKLRCDWRDRSYGWKFPENIDLKSDWRRAGVGHFIRAEFWEHCRHQLDRN